MSEESVETTLARISEKVENVPQLMSDIQEIKQYMASQEERINQLEKAEENLQDFKNGQLSREYHTPENCPNKRSIKNLWWMVGLVNAPVAFTVLGLGVKIVLI